MILAAAFHYKLALTKLAHYLHHPYCIRSNYCSELVIDQCIETGELNDVHYHGVLSDGSMYESTNLMTCSPDSKYIGKILDENMFDIVGCTIAHRGDPSKNTDTSDDFQPKRWWVKCKLKSGEYLVTSGKGYNIWNAIAILKQ